VNGDPGTEEGDNLVGIAPGAYPPAGPSGNGQAQFGQEDSLHGATYPGHLDKSIPKAGKPSRFYVRSPPRWRFVRRRR